MRPHLARLPGGNGEGKGRVLTPEHIVECLDQLELAADSPTVLKLVGDLKWHIARWAAETATAARECQQLVEQNADQRREIEDLYARLHEVVV